LFHKELFILAHQFGDSSFYPAYKKLIRNQWKSYDELKCDQEKQLRHAIEFAYENVPYYHNLFKYLGILPTDICMIEDLQKLPILTKDIIKKHWEDFKPVGLDTMKYYANSTGGSTGTPFQCRLFKYDRFLSGAMLYRGWGYAGYELGDKVVFLGGSSLDIGSKPFIIKKAHEIARNIQKLSSFDMDTDNIQKYVDIINSFKPKYLRGYPSSLNFFANYITKNNLEIISPSGIFTTAEKLFPNMRRNIENAFNCDVYDGYGLNDGGVSAYECSEHLGLHIDMERSVMEVVDRNGYQLDEGEGRILATSLHNFAMPFIRYDTGDIGCILSERCSCDRRYKLLKELVGRSVDILITPEGMNVHGWFFLYIFWEYCKGIREYQVVQEELERIVIKIVLEDDFDERQLYKIRESVKKRSAGWHIEFKFVDKIERTGAGKYKFVINKLMR